MRVWSVDLIRRDGFSLEVEAETPEEAMSLAKERLCDSEDPLNDFESWQEGFQVTGCRG